MRVPIVLLIILISSVFLFQNCGSGFESVQGGSLSSFDGGPIGSANTKACPILNGIGESILVGDIYGPCTVKSCNLMYQAFNNFCVPVSPNPPYVPAATSLRAMGAKLGLQMGSVASIDYIKLDPTYARVLREQYGLLAAANHMKWVEVQPQKDVFDFTKGDQVVDFAITNSQKIHGHTLVWHQQNPGWLTSGSFTPLELRALLQKHIQNVMGHYKSKYPGVVRSWDVVNEAMLASDVEVRASTNGGFRQTLWSNIGSNQPDEYIKLAFQWANQADPQALLYYNDFNNDGLNDKSNAIFNMISRLRSQSIPIHVVGIQGHYSTDYPVPTVATLRQNIARYKAIGVKVHFTEVDVRTNATDGVDAIELQKQQQIYANVFEACRLELPICIGITTWGFTNKYSWIYNAFPGYSPVLPFDANFNETGILNIIKSKLQ